MSAPAPTTNPPSKRVAFEVSATPTPKSSATLKPYTAAKDTFVSGCSALQYLDTKQSTKLAKAYADLLLKMDQRIKVKVKFDNALFLPKPLRLKPSLRASSAIQETNAYKEAVSAEASAIESYQSAMRNAMASIACEELLSAQYDLMHFSIKLIQNLLKYNQMTDVNGDNQFEELSDRRLSVLTNHLLKDEEFLPLRFKCSDRTLTEVCPSSAPDTIQDNPYSTDEDRRNLEAALDLDRYVMTEEIAKIRTSVRAILLRPLEAYALAGKLAETKNEVFLLFEEAAVTGAAENMNDELENVEIPVTADLIAKVKDAVTASIKNDLAVKEHRGASKKGASSKKKLASTAASTIPKKSKKGKDTRNATQSATTKEKGSKKAKGKQKKSKKRNGSETP